MPPLDPKISALIDEVRATRTRLATDLAAAAGALDAEHPEVARDIVAGGLDDVAAFRAAAIARLNSEERPTEERPARRPIRHSRALLALPTVPLVGGLAMTAAAALSGGGAPAHQSSHHATKNIVAARPSPTHSTLPLAAHSTLRRLENVVEHHPRASEVVAVADDLHKQLTLIISASSNNPLQLKVVKRLLSTEQHVLEGTDVPGVTVALAASRQVAELLDKSTAPVVVTLHPKDKTPSPTHSSSTSSKSSTTQSTPKTSRHHKKSSRPKLPSSTPKPLPTRTNPLLPYSVFGSNL